MIAQALAPAKIVSLPMGKKINYAGHTFCHSKNGQLSLNSAKPAEMVSFIVYRGMAEYRCFAAIKNDCVYFFEGATIGSSMITEEKVKEALSQV